MDNSNLITRHKIILLMTLLLFFACNGYGQIQLIDIKTSKCMEDGMRFKPIYQQTWLNDSILQIETTAGSNCAGISNPRVATFGPVLMLKFDEHAPDGSSANCVCVFHNTWKIKGIKKKDKFILLLNGKLSRDYNPSLLKELLRSYSIDNTLSNLFLLDAIDKKGLKQGHQAIKNCDRTLITIYKDGKELRTF